MNKFYVFLVLNFFLIHFAAIPQFGRLIAYPLLHLITGDTYRDDWFCNPIWTFFIAGTALLKHIVPLQLLMLFWLFLLVVLPAIITVMFWFSNWKSKYVKILFIIYLLSCFINIPLSTNNIKSFYFLFWPSLCAI